MWKNIWQAGRPQMTIRCMGIAFWIPKATNTQWDYVVFIAFPPENWLRESASVLSYTYIACLVYIFSIVIRTFLLPVMYRKSYRHNYTWNYKYMYSFFIRCNEFNFAQMHTKFSRSCPHYIQDWASLHYSTKKRTYTALVLVRTYTYRLSIR
jgi:hypothetical protein